MRYPWRYHLTACYHQRAHCRSVSPEIVAEMERLAASPVSISVSEVHRHIEEMFGETLAIPTERTIYNILRDLTIHDDSEEWQFAETDGDEAALILPVLADIAHATQGHRTSITNREAGWVVRLRRAVPDLAPLWAYAYARHYILRLQREQPTTDLDMLLSFAPWRGKEHAERYTRALNAGWIPDAPPILVGESGLVQIDFVANQQALISEWQRLVRQVNRNRRKKEEENKDGQ